MLVLARGGIGAPALAEFDFAFIEVLLELVPLSGGRGPILTSRPRRAPAGEMGLVVADDIFLENRHITVGGLDIQMPKQRRPDVNRQSVVDQVRGEQAPEVMRGEPNTTKLRVLHGEEVAEFRQFVAECAWGDYLGALPDRALEQERLAACAGEATQAIQEAHDALASWIAYDSTLQPEEARAIIDRSLQEITSLRNRVGAQYRNVPRWKKWAWPDAATLAPQEAFSFLRRVQRRLEGMRVAAQPGQATNRGQLMSLLGAVGVMEIQIRDFLAAIYAAQEERERQAQQIIAETMAKVSRERRLAEKQLMVKRDVVFARLREAIGPFLRRLNERTEAVKHEGVKLGMTL